MDFLLTGAKLSCSPPFTFWIKDSLSLLLTPTKNVDPNGQDHNSAGDNNLPLLRNGHNAQAVGQRTDDEGADNGTQDSTFSTT